MRDATEAAGNGSTTIALLAVPVGWGGLQPIAAVSGRPKMPEPTADDAENLPKWLRANDLAAAPPNA